MYRFIRTATARNASATSVALKAAADITAYVNRQYSLNMKHGIEVFGKQTVHWHFEADSIDKMLEMNARLMQDRDYSALLEKYKDVWVEGSLKDTLVVLA